MQQPMTEAMYYILLALLHPGHGYGMMQRIRELSSGRVDMGPGTLYGAINTLLDRGWLELYSAQDYSRKKKEYRITPAGRAAFRAEMDRLRELTANGEKMEEDGP